MRLTRLPFIASALLLGASFSLTGCGGSGSGSDASGAASPTGAYTSVNDDGLAFEFKSGGVVTMTAKAMNVSSTGSYTSDGDKLLVTIDGQQHTFIRDGKCIQEGRHIFGKLCQGGKAGEASNVSTRKPPVTEGVWAGSNADGQFRIEFKPGNKVTLTATMAGGGKTDTEDGTYVVDGDRVDVRLPGGMPLILQFVNNAYDTTSFGLPLKLTKQ